MRKVNMDTVRPFVAQKVLMYLGFEDDVVIEFICNQLEERVINYVFIACIAVTFVAVRSYLNPRLKLVFWVTGV